MTDFMKHGREAWLAWQTSGIHSCRGKPIIAQQLAANTRSVDEGAVRGWEGSPLMFAK